MSQHTPSSRTAGIRAEGIAKSFGDVSALEPTDLSVERGEFVSLLGPSGCGKTTTLRCIAGLETPDRGNIWLGDHHVFGAKANVPTHKRRLGMVFQSYAVWPHMNVFDNIGYPLKVEGAPATEIESRVQDIMSLVGLAGYGSRYVSEISGGQQQRVALARAVVADPAVVLYDEPLSNLDTRLREQMRFELRRLHDRLGTTALYVTHDQEEALMLSDRIYVMDAGRVEQHGTPVEMYERPSSEHVCKVMGPANIFGLAGGAVRELAGGSDHQPLELVSGAVVYVPSSSASAGTKSPSALAFRPHRVQICGNATGASSGGINVFQVEIRSAAYLGNHVRYTTTFPGDDEIVIDSPAGDELWRTGQTIVVRIAPEDCIVF